MHSDTAKVRKGRATQDTPAVGLLDSPFLSGEQSVAMPNPNVVLMLFGHQLSRSVMVAA